MATWRDAVRVELARYRTQTGESIFTLQDVYERSLEQIRTQFPENDHPKAKLRQILQQLRDRGEIEFTNQSGNYRISSLNLSELGDEEFDRIASAEFEKASTETSDTPVELSDGDVDPIRVRRVVEAVSRDRTLTDRLKRRYDHECQLCGTRRRRTRQKGTRKHTTSNRSGTPTPARTSPKTSSLSARITTATWTTD